MPIATGISTAPGGRSRAARRPSTTQRIQSLDFFGSVAAMKPPEEPVRPGSRRGTRAARTAGDRLGCGDPKEAAATRRPRRGPTPCPRRLPRRGGCAGPSAARELPRHRPARRASRWSRPGRRTRTAASPRTPPLAVGFRGPVGHVGFWIRRLHVLGPLRAVPPAQGSAPVVVPAGRCRCSCDRPSRAETVVAPAAHASLSERIGSTISSFWDEAQRNWQPIA